MQSSISYKKIKKGYITKFIKSKILRDDITCSIAECPNCEQGVTTLSWEHPLIFLTSKLIRSQIDAWENFKIIDNCIIPQSEYNLLLEHNDKILPRLKFIMENRNYLIYPNEYNKDIALIPDEKSLTKTQRNNLMFNKTVDYFSKHWKAMNNPEYSIIIIDDSEDMTRNKENIKSYNMISYAREQMSNSPDWFNYVAVHEDDSRSKKQIYSQHLTEKEMKSKIKTGELFQGKIFFQPGIDHVAIVKSVIFDKDIIVDGYINLNRAMNGDIVCFSFWDEKEWIKKEGEVGISDDNQEEDIADNIEEFEWNHPNQEQVLNIKEKVSKSTKSPTGLIHGILRRFRDLFCGTIYNANEPGMNSINETYNSYLTDNCNNKEICLFIPIDSKYPNFYINLYKKENYYNQRIIVKYDLWQETSPGPFAHFFKSLGQCFEIPVENDIIWYEHNVDINPFSQKIIDSMPKDDIELKYGDEELKNRLDLRNIIVCSIDPPNCKDIDDALSCEVMPNGNYRVGVHIADVTHYVKPGSEVDRIAAKNCNTIYLVHKRTDMLPKVLTENWCSLVGGKERLAFSVLWEIEKDTLEIKNVIYSKTVIKSKAALTYEKANTIMNDPSDHSDWAESIRNWNKIAKYLKSKRIKDGALILASNEMKFNLDAESNCITDISVYKSFETNSLVEEFMLLANVWVAKKIYEAYPSCAILRRHPPPKEKELSSFVATLKQQGYEIDTSSSFNLSKSLDNISKKNDPFFNKLIRSWLTRTMNQAKYFPSCEYSYEEFYHYGLAMDIYTHFTSPIRRYADDWVHRLLAAALEIDYFPQDMSNKVKADRGCTQMNKQNRVGFFCGRDSNYFSAFCFFKDHEKERKSVEIVIHSISTTFIKGISIKYGIEANIDFSKIGIDYIDLDKNEVGLKNDEKVRWFDHVIVEINPSVFNYRYEIKYYYLNKVTV